MGALAPLRYLNWVGPFETTLTYDVAIFYCGARQIGNADPYEVEPLATCERSTSPILFSDGAIAPAPQPAYVLVGLKALSWLSEERFAFTWIVVLIGLAMASAGFLSRLTGFPAIGIFLGTILGSGYENLSSGQLSMLVLLGIAGAAYALRKGRPRVAAGMAVLTFTEPHIALPVVFALLVLEPRARVPLFIACAAALAVMLAVTGPTLTLEYFTRVLPLQALAEARHPDQYSLTLLAAAAGASDTIAVRLGEVQYALFSLAAVFFAKRLRDRYGDASFVVAIPAAAAVIGGPFIHYSELIALWPAALLLASKARGKNAIAAAVAIALAGYPCRSVVPHWLRLGIIVVYVFFAWSMTAKLERRVRVLACSAIALPVVLAGLLKERIPQIPIVTIPQRLPEYVAAVARQHDLAPVPWGMFLRQTHHVLTLREIATKLPTLAVIGVLIYFAVALARPLNRLAQPQIAKDWTNSG